MRVLLVSHGYPPVGVGGVERLSMQTAEGLVGRGHEVTVLTRRSSNAPPQLALARGMRNGVSVVAAVGGGLPVEEFPRNEREMERVFERLLAECEPDVVLITHLLHHSPGYIAIAHRLGVPVVLELHDFFTLCPRAHLERVSGELCAGPESGLACATHCFSKQAESRLRWALRSESFRMAVQGADLVVAPSRFLADSLASLRGASESIRVLDNAVADLGPVLPGERFPGGALRIASIGVTIKHKGFQVVLDALRMAQLPAVQYNVFGVPLQPLAGRLQAAAEEVPNLRLRLAGDFQASHLPVLLADSQVVVVPSLVAETYSIVAREAFACGLPVIASRIGALPEAVRVGETGWLFEPGDAAGLAVLLQQLDADRAALVRAGAAAAAERVTGVAERTQRMEHLLREAVSAPHQAGGQEGVELQAMREQLGEADQARRAEVYRAALRAMP